MKELDLIEQLCAEEEKEMHSKVSPNKEIVIDDGNGDSKGSVTKVECIKDPKEEKEEEEDEELVCNQVKDLFSKCYSMIKKLECDAEWAFDTRVKLETREEDWQAGELDDSYMQDRLAKMQRIIEKRLQKATKKDGLTNDTTSKAATNADDKNLADADDQNLAERQASLLARIRSHPLYPSNSEK